MTKRKEWRPLCKVKTFDTFQEAQEFANQNKKPVCLFLKTNKQNVCEKIKEVTKEFDITYIIDRFEIAKYQSLEDFVKEEEENINKKKDSFPINFINKQKELLQDFVKNAKKQEHDLVLKDYNAGIFFSEKRYQMQYLNYVIGVEE